MDIVRGGRGLMVCLILDALIERRSVVTDDSAYFIIRSSSH